MVLARMRTMRTCFFLGAGASAEFGYPVTSQILPLIREGLHNRILFSFRSDGKQLCEQLEDFLTRLFPGFQTADEKSLPSVVDLLSLVDHSLRSSTTPVRLIPVHILGEMRTLLEVAICNVISPAERKPKRAGRDFWSWLESANNLNRDSIALISTNYDTSIEQIIASTLGFHRTTTFLDFGVAWRDPDREEPYSRPVKPWMRFYKLHGSLNWLRCDMCEHMYLNYKWDIYKRVLDKKVLDKNSCHCGHGKLSLMLVTPSYIRDVREPNLLSIWQNALELLRTSDEWVFVGYSLPSDDINIRSMIMRATQGRDTPPKVTVVLDKNHPEVYGRYRLLFPMFVPSSQGFGEYIKQLSR
jgi:NAD-dependent SIR2 family protein deacetylase